MQRYYRYLLPLMPWAARWRLPDADLVLSTSHCVAKSALPAEGTPHVCYCFTPMRYAWHMKESYFGQSRGLKYWLRDKLLQPHAPMGPADRRPRQPFRGDQPSDPAAHSRGL